MTARIASLSSICPACRVQVTAEEEPFPDLRSANLMAVDARCPKCGRRLRVYSRPMEARRAVAR